MKRKIRIGCSGFSGRDWKGFFYPEDLPAKEELNYYSTVFRTVEINSTFYRKPRQTTIQNWYDRTSEDFRFFIKIPKKITHELKLDNTAGEVKDFCDYIAESLNEKLAGFLFQLPPSFQYDVENLQKVLDALDPNYLNAVEFRHKSWWNDEVLKIFTEREIVFVGVSIPKNISSEVMVTNSNFAYYRLHGAPVIFKSEYSETYLENLAKEIQSANREVYVFFNNTWGIAALKNAQLLQNLLKD
jgi:uncharacterized protein YecE (DUF72 family)